MIKIEEACKQVFAHEKEKIRKGSVRKLTEKALNRLAKMEVETTKDIKDAFNAIKGFTSEADDRKLNWRNLEFMELYSNSDMIETVTELTGMTAAEVRPVLYKEMENLKMFDFPSAVALLTNKVEQQ